MTNTINLEEYRNKRKDAEELKRLDVSSVEVFGKMFEVDGKSIAEQLMALSIITGEEDDRN